MDSSRQPGIVLNQVFLESAEFDHREDFLSLPPQPAPGDLDIEMQAQWSTAANKKSGVIKLRIRTNPKADGHYRFALTMGALVSAQDGAENMDLEHYATTHAVALLFPFAREAVANITSRGRFGPIWLHPFNFVAPFGDADSSGGDSGPSKATRGDKAPPSPRRAVPR